MSQASMESFLLGESTEQLIARCVKSSVNADPNSVERHRGDSYDAARSLDETERLLRIRTERFIDFFCRTHREWRVTAYIPFVIQHMVAVDEADLTDSAILQDVQDLRQIGELGEPRTAAQVAEDQAEADRLAILRDLAERKELIDRLMAAQPRNNQRLTRIDDAAFAQTRETVRKGFERLSTEQLRQKVRELEFNSKMRGLSHDELVEQVRSGASAPDQTQAQSRECPEFALPQEYTADKLRNDKGLIRKLAFFANGQSRPAAQGSHYTTMQMINDRLQGKS